MSFRIDVLQKFLDSPKSYWLAEHEQSAWIIFPDVPDEFFGKSLRDLPYGEVEKFSRSCVNRNIPVTDSYEPFQAGVWLGEFSRAEELTCPAKELLIALRDEKRPKFIRAVEVMKQLSSKGVA